MIRKYRPATLEDAEALLGLILRAYAQNKDLGIQFDATKADLQMIQTHIRNNMCFLYEEDEKLVGTISLRMPWGLQPGPSDVPHIGWLAVDPTYGKRGIGSQILKWLEKEILRDTLRVPFVTLGTADKHPWLSEMYKRKGYEKFAEKDLGKGHITHYFKKIIREDLIQ